MSEPRPKGVLKRDGRSRNKGKRSVSFTTSLHRAIQEEEISALRPPAPTASAADGAGAPAAAAPAAATDTAQTTIRDAADVEQERTLSEETRSLLSQPVPVLEARDGENRSPLHSASLAGLTSVVESLLLAGVDPFCVDYHGNTPLHLAVSQQHEDVVALLLHYGADPAARNRMGRTALHYAAMNATGRTVRLLLAADPTISLIADSAGMTPMHKAVMFGNAECVDHLLKLGNDNVHIQDNLGCTCLHYAASKSSEIPILTTLLLDAKVDPAKVANNSMTAIHVAAACGNERGLDILLQHSGVHVDKPGGREGLTPLQMAATMGHAPCIRTLIHKHNASLTVFSGKGKPALHYAVSHEHAECVRVLLELGADPNMRSATRLASDSTSVATAPAAAPVSGMLASLSGRQRVRSRSAGAAASGSAPVADGSGRGRGVMGGDTALHIASCKASMAAARPFNSDEYRRYPIDEIVDLLLAQGANPLLETIHGRTCLHLATIAVVSKNRTIELLYRTLEACEERAATLPRTTTASRALARDAQGGDGGNDQDDAERNPAAATAAKIMGSAGGPAPEKDAAVSPSVGSGRPPRPPRSGLEARRESLTPATSTQFKAIEKSFGAASDDDEAEKSLRQSSPVMLPVAARSALRESVVGAAGAAAAEEQGSGQDIIPPTPPLTAYTHMPKSPPISGLLSMASAAQAVEQDEYPASSTRSESIGSLAESTLSEPRRRTESLLREEQRNSQPSPILKKEHAGVYINQVDHSGCTALHYAIAAATEATQSQAMVAIQTLVDHGAQLDVVNFDGKIPWSYAVNRLPLVANMLILLGSKPPEQASKCTVS